MPLGLLRRLRSGLSLCTSRRSVAYSPQSIY